MTKKTFLIRIFCRLHFATLKENVECVRILAEARPDTLRQRDIKGNTPLLIACGPDTSSGMVSASVVRVLVDADATKDTVGIPDRTGRTPFYLACRPHASAVVLEVLEQAVPGMSGRKNGNEHYPLHVAACYHSVGKIRFLVALAPQALEAKGGRKSWRPVDYAANTRNAANVEALLEFMPGVSESERARLLQLANSPVAEVPIKVLDPASMPEIDPEEVAILKLRVTMNSTFAIENSFSPHTFVSKATSSRDVVRRLIDCPRQLWM